MIKTSFYREPWLNKLAQSLCSELGSKGDIDHTTVNVGNLQERKKKLLEYMKQDIYLLGGRMLKAQEICCSEYNIDPLTARTISAQAIHIFIMKYYDDLRTFLIRTLIHLFVVAVSIPMYIIREDLLYYVRDKFIISFLNERCAYR